MYVTSFFFLVSMLLVCGTIASAATLRLSWQDTSSNESGFKIERLSGASYVEIATVGVNVQAYSDATAASGTTYCYRIKAFNAAGVSAPTNAGCATAPSGLDDGGSTPRPRKPSTPPIPPVPPSPSFEAWKDYQVRATLRSTDNDTLGVMFRYQDPNNYYRFTWFSEGKMRRLEKRVDGVFQVLAQDREIYQTGETYALQISAQGSSLNVIIDGKSIFSVTDASFTRGTIGLYSYYNAGSHFDDIHVQDLHTGNTLAVDDFKDGDHVGWTIIDEGTDAGPSKWAVSNGALVQNSNIGGDAVGSYALYTRGSWTNYRMTLKMRSSDDDRLGVLFRFKDSNNHYRFVWNQASPGRRLLKKINGTFEVLSQDTVPYVTNQWYNVEIIVQGDALKINIDGKSVFAVTDSSFSAGSVALYSSNNESSHFQDVLVEDVKSKNVLLWDDFTDNNLAGWKAFDEPGTTQGPSKWSVSSGMLVQSSNIGSDAPGFPGTFLLY